MAFLCINQELPHIMTNYVDKLFPESIIISVPIFASTVDCPHRCLDGLGCGDKHSIYVNDSILCQHQLRREKVGFQRGAFATVST